MAMHIPFPKKEGTLALNFQPQRGNMSAQAWSPNTREERQATVTGYPTAIVVAWLPGAGLGMKIGTWGGGWLKGTQDLCCHAPLCTASRRFAFSALPGSFCL